jgi:cell division protein FtsW
MPHSAFPQGAPKPPVLLDPIIVSVTFLLLFASVVMVYSTTGVVSQERFGDPFYYVKRQAVAAVIGVVLMFFCSRIPPSLLQSLSKYLYPVCALLLIIPLLPVVGDDAGGAKRWVDLRVVRFQPGEFVKLMFVVFAAGFFSRHEHKLGHFIDGIVKPVALVGVLGACYLMQPDFGSTVVLLLVALCMGLVAGVKVKHITACAIGCAIPLTILVLSSPYRLSRVVHFLSPFSDPSGKGYQLIQSLIAVGSGEVTGKGLGGSEQKLFFLPAAHTDFIFAVIGEELGFIGCVSILVLFSLLLWRGATLASRLSHNTFCCALATGLTMLIVIPALLNTGVVTGLLPTKGMVLPLIGYGGSSLVVCLMAIGLLLGLARSLYRGAV